MEQENDIHSEL